MGDILGGGSSSSSSSTATNSTNVTVNSTTQATLQAQIINQVDLTPVQRLIDSLSGVNRASIDAVVKQAGATADLAQSVTQGLTTVALQGQAQAKATDSLAQSIASGQSVEIWGALIGLLAALIAAGLIGKKKGWL